MGLTTDYQLGDLELAVMDLIWRQPGEVTVRRIWEALQPTRSVAYTTVMTIMGRLVGKGVLAVRKQGKTSWYRATGTAEETQALQAQRAVHDVLANFGDAAITSFVRELQTSDPDALRKVRALLGEE